MRRGTAGLILALLCVAACRSTKDASPQTPAVVAAPPEPVDTTPPLRELMLDTAGRLAIDIWPLVVAPGRQLEETRRIVEHLQADLSLVRGFEIATLLASGDGSRLVVLVAWKDTTASERTRVQLAEWLHADVDTAMLRQRTGSATVRMQMRSQAGTPPTLSDAGMVQLTRYAMKPGHSFGALAALADTNLRARVVQDTAARGGVTLMAADSGALYMLLQARTATALDPGLVTRSGLPFWAPFAQREEQLLAVIAIVRKR